ncbi:MAG: hypothetical protein II320_04690 [Oscillospiraceae bacterium]|nr:hypothetical protein [Oscillospiraceae bacterium]
MRRRAGREIALCGVMAALAVTVMFLGTLIPIATFVCPMLCMMVLSFVLTMVGRKLAWVWYVAVAVLSLLLVPDKEACTVFVFFGYYPIVKPWFDRRRPSFLWKLVLFNVLIFLMYGLLIWVLGLQSVAEDLQEAGTVVTVITLILGNVTLFMLDVLLGRFGALAKRKR